MPRAKKSINPEMKSKFTAWVKMLSKIEDDICTLHREMDDYDDELDERNDDDTEHEKGQWRPCPNEQEAQMWLTEAKEAIWNADDPARNSLIHLNRALKRLDGDS